MIPYYENDKKMTNINFHTDPTRSNKSETLYKIMIIKIQDILSRAKRALVSQQSRLMVAEDTSHSLDLFVSLPTVIVVIVQCTSNMIGNIMPYGACMIVPKRLTQFR